MTTTTNLWDAARREMDEYKLAADLSLQPRWEVPEKIAIHTAVSGRLAQESREAAGGSFPTSLDSFVEASAQVIDAGAAAVHFDYTWIEDPSGRRLDRDLTPVEAYRTVVDPLRERFGNQFIVDCNVLNGTTFEECVSPATEGIAEVAPCAPGHPEEWMVPAVEALERSGVKPMLAIHSSGEIELAKRKLIDPGILKPPYYYVLLYGLPFSTGRTLVSGTWVPNAQDMARHMFLMVDQIKSIDEDSVIVVCAAGRAGLYMTTLATMLGLHIRVGTEDTIWKHPNSDELAGGNLELVEKAIQIAELHGRTPATADEYRALLKLPEIAYKI
jgi:uncharacterized protein (DUF849 family)